MESRLYTVREAAKLLTIKESTVYRWIFDRKIGVTRIGSRSVRISSDEISRILDAGRVDAEIRSAV